MKVRQLGSTGLRVSEVGFGAWQLGNNDHWAGMDDAAAHALVAKALDNGVTLFDTAPNYAQANSERLLGEALQGKRDQVVLVSKFGHRSDETLDFSTHGFWTSLHGSLERLKTDHLDVILLHNPPPDFLSGNHEIWNVMRQAQAQGKIRFYGASVDYAHEIRQVLDTTDAHVLEILFNVLHQDARAAFDLVRDKNVGILTKVPLDSGWLTGRFTAESRFEGIRARWSREDIRRRAELVGQLDWLTADGAPLAEKALAYLLSYEEVSCIIPGMRTPGQLETNLSAAGQRLCTADRIRLEQFWDDFTKNGSERLPW